MHSAIILAGWLSRRSVDELAALIEARLTPADRTPAHHTDIALKLLKPDSIERALRTLDTTQLRALDDPASAPETVLKHLESLGLVTQIDGKWKTLDEVLESLALLLPSVEFGEDRPHDPAPPDVTPVSDHWAQVAFVGAQRCVLLLRSFDLAPARVTRTGALTVASQKSITQLTQVPIDELPLLWSLVSSCEFATVVDYVIRVADHAWRWMQLPHAPRWLELVACMIAALPEPLKLELGESTSLRHAAEHLVPARYPLLDEQTRATIRMIVEVAELCGATEHGMLTPAAHALLTGETELALDLTHAAFPTPAPGVYLQPDLSVIAPGPLTPEVGLRLLELTSLSNPGVATSMQLTKDSLTEALNSGWSPDEIRAFLIEVSLTPLPQPLEYLLDDLSRTHGSVVVAPATDHGAHSRISCATAQLARELTANVRLTALGLTPGENERELLTRLSATHAHSMLVQAGVAATLRSQYADDLRVDHSRTSPSAAAQFDDIAFIDRLRTRLRPPARARWAFELAKAIVQASESSPRESIEHALELAIRTSSTVRVRVSAGDEAREFVLQPITITGNRLRALDAAAGLERTFLLSAITEIVATP